MLIILKSTDKNYFFESYHWLILSKSQENVLDVLNNIKLNINSDLHLVVPNGRENFTIFDIYNPASQHGGKLIPHLDKSLKEYLVDDKNRQVNSMHRFQNACVNRCKELFNFSLHIQRTNSWGYVQADGYFDGLVGLLERRVVDFGSSPLIYKLDRIPVLSVDNNQDGVDSSWSFVFLFALGTFCQQGGTCYPKLFSSRILSLFVFLFCLLIYQFYSASIVSYLLMDPPRTIHNLKDLVESALRVGIEDILIDRNYFV
ncbi:hypothetical protein NQ314_018517, partial [Rhamnusium bicolor]